MDASDAALVGAVRAGRREAYDHRSGFVPVRRERTSHERWARAEPFRQIEPVGDLREASLSESFQTFGPSFDEIFDRLWSNFGLLTRPNFARSSKDMARFAGEVCANPTTGTTSAATKRAVNRAERTVEQMEEQIEAVLRMGRRLTLCSSSGGVRTWEYNLTIVI